MCKKYYQPFLGIFGTQKKKVSISFCVHEALKINQCGGIVYITNNIDHPTPSALLRTGLKFPGMFYSTSEISATCFF